MRPPTAAKSPAPSKNIHLYTDDNPETTIKGMGFRDKATALRTLELVKQKPRSRQIWSVNTMLHRSVFVFQATAASRTQGKAPPTQNPCHGRSHCRV